MNWERGKFGFFVLLFQIVLLIFFILYGKYDLEADASYRPNSLNVNKNGNDPADNTIEKYQIHHQFMILTILFVFGYGFCFSESMLFSITTFNLLFYSLAFQWSLIFSQFVQLTPEINLNVKKFLESQRKCLAVALSFAVNYGKISLTQTVVIIFFEVPILCLCTMIIQKRLIISDVGFCHEIYLFGSVFGVSIACTQRKLISNVRNRLTISDGALMCRMQSIAIMLFLVTFLFSMDQEGHHKHRVLINTMLSLCGAITFSFASSSFFDAQNRPNLVHVQGGVISGLISMSAIANLMINPAVAILIGAFTASATISSLTTLQPRLLKNFRLHDTCCVISTILLPSLLSSLIGVYLALTASEDNYDFSLYDLYPVRTPLNGTEAFEQLITYSKPKRKAGGARIASMQALMQLLGLFITVASATIGGLAIGTILKWRFFSPLPVGQLLRERKLYWDNMTQVTEHHSPEENTSEMNRLHGTISKSKRPSTSSTQMTDISKN